MRLVFTMFAIASALSIGTPAPAQTDCEAARCAVQAAINEACSCTEAGNHGRYVSCVAHVVRRLTDEGAIPINCRGKVKRCAARSTCGRPGFVTCRRPVDTCDPATLTCVGNPALACATDIDCGSRCSTKRSADTCTALGGVAGSGSCCSACVTTP
jgi:hypothetical protein